MFANMKLGTKIIVGFMAILFIMAIIGITSIWMMADVKELCGITAEEYMPAAKAEKEISDQQGVVALATRSYALSEADTYYTQAMAAFDKTDELIKTASTLAASKKNLVKMNEALPEIKTKLDSFKTLFAKTKEINTKKDAARTDLSTAEDQFGTIFYKILSSRNKAVKDSLAEPAKAQQAFQSTIVLNEVVDLFNELRFIIWKSQTNAADKDEKIANIDSTLSAIAAKVEEVHKFDLTDDESKNLGDLEKAVTAFSKGIKDFQAANGAMAQLTADRTTAYLAVQKLVSEASDAAMTKSTEGASDCVTKSTNTISTIVIGLLIALVVGVVLALFITRSITSAITRVINGLNDGANQVAAAAGQVSTASQQLAEGATEQASALEESSSALEEMASMTRQNADNAKNANGMMATTKKQVDGGSVAVKNMAGAMSEINDSSEKISNIIKTIEEIAFQTNLLALNAAVEAARAGDAGKGFAVVADEVRNLAQRSAQAARDTAELIESTVTRVRNGTEIVQQLEESFSEIEGSAGKVATLISEITAASQEQAQGVDQVNNAVAQMDKVTQSNAANAEESASASEELSAQADQLREMVGVLSAMVGGAAQMQQNYASSHAPAKRPIQQHAHLQIPHMKTRSSGSTKALSGGSQPAKVVKPNDLIPLEEDGEFKDF